MSDAGAWIFLVGRVIFALNFVAIAAPAHFKMSKMMEGFAKQMRFPVPKIAGRPSGLWLAACGLSVALGAWGDVGSLMIAVFVVIAGAFFHRFWEVEDAQKQTQKQLFWRNVTFLGAALILFVFYAAFGHDLALTLTDPVFDLRP
jgi:uncharacterized membrane protein YphA (DoxX/SURF4 family)